MKMVRMRMVFFLSMLVPFCNSRAAGREIWLEKETIERSAIACCDIKRYDCCVESLKFGKPLWACDFEEENDARGVYNCLQEKLFQKEQRMSFDDSQCCRVFHPDDNDPSKFCERTCKSIMVAPSLRKEERIERIERCTTTKNPISECFHTCLLKQTTGQKMTVLRFDDVCNITLYRKTPQLRPN